MHDKLLQLLGLHHRRSHPSHQLGSCTREHGEGEIGFLRDFGGWSCRLSAAVIESYKELMTMLGDGRLNPLVSNTFPLADTRKGIDLIVSRKATGKVIITIDH